MDEDERDLIDLMFAIMRSKHANTRVVELAANIIAADARLNERVGNAKWQSEFDEPRLRRLFDIVVLVDVILTECKLLARQFEEGCLSRELLCDRLTDIRKKVDEVDL